MVLHSLFKALFKKKLAWNIIFSLGKISLRQKFCQLDSLDHETINKNAESPPKFALEVEA